MRNSIITASLEKRTSYKELRYKQFDTGHQITIKVILNGRDYPLTDYVALAFFKLPNQPLEQRNCIVDGNVLTIELDSYLLSEAGIVPFEIELHKFKEITTIFRMQYVVEESFDTDEAITNQSSWEIFHQLLEIDVTNYVTYDKLEEMFTDAQTGLTVDLRTYPKKSDLHSVATSGQYSDLKGKPTKLSDFQNDLVEENTDANQVVFTDGETLQDKFDWHELGSGNGGTGGGTIISGSGYGVITKDNSINGMITANTSNDVLNIEAEGLSEIALSSKTSPANNDTLKITTRFPTWDELAGDPLTIFNHKDFIYENNILGINTANIGGGGSGGGLPFINVKSFKVWERNPSTGVLEEVSYGAKGDNTSPDLDTKAFKRAFEIAKDEGSVNIYIPDGNYILKETINIFRNTNVQASRNATIKKNHTSVMFANTLPTDAFVGYDGGKVGNPSIKNNGNIFFDGGIWSNDGTSGSTFSFINAQNFEFKNLTVLDVLDSHVFDLAGISDMIIYNCNFLGFQYRRIGEKDASGNTITDVTTLKAYSECIQLDYSTQEAFPYQLAGQDGTACKRIRVDKCVFGKSSRFPAWNRVFGGHNTYVPTYDWLHQANGTPTGNSFNFLDSKVKDVYFLNNVVEGNGTLKYDYDQNDSENFIIQQVRLQCVDNAIVMNNKFRDVKGGISIDVDQTPKTMNPDPLKKNFNLTGTASYTKSGVMPAKVSYVDKRGDTQTIMFSSSASDQDLSKITTHTHNGITYTIVWCKTTKFVDYYGWQNALIMNNELTNITCGIFNMKQVTATSSSSTALDKLIVQDVVDVLGNTVIKSGTEIYYDSETNPRTVTSVVGVPSTDINGNPIQIAPYTLTVNPSFTTLASASKPIYLKDSPSKNASTPIFVRGKTTPYSTITVTTNPDGTKKYTYVATSTVQAPRGKKCIIYGNIIDGLDQKTVYSQYEDVIKNGRSVTKISAIDTTKTILTLSAVTDKYIKAGENLYYNGDLTTPYQIMNVDTATKKVTIFPAITSSANTSGFMWSRKPILAGETSGASIINAIQGGYIHDLLIQKNVIRNVPRAIYISGSTRMNIIGNHFFQINEVEAICIDGGDYSSIIGNTFSDLNDQSIEMRNTNYFNIANNEFVNINKGKIFTSAYAEVPFTYNPLDIPTIIVMGDGVADGQYGVITGNMFVHNNANPIKVGIQSPETTKYIKMSNNSFPSTFVLQQDNRSDVGLDYGYRGNDADTLQGKNLDTLGDNFVAITQKGVANGVASLGADGKVISSQLPVSSGGGAGFKTINIPNGENITATTLSNILNLKTSGGISLDIQSGNVLEIGYDNTLVQHIPTIELNIIDLQDTQGILGEEVDALNVWKVLNDAKISDIDSKNDMQDSDILALQNRASNIESTNVFQDNTLSSYGETLSNHGAMLNNHDGHLTGIDGTLSNNNTRIQSVEAHRDDSTIHVTTSDKNNWNGKSDLSFVNTNFFKKTGSTKQTVSPTVQFDQNISISKYEEKIGTATSGACDLSSGSIFNIPISAPVTISFINPTITSSYVYGIVIYLVTTTVSTVTFPASVKWHNGELPVLIANKSTEIVLRTIDGGTTWFASSGGIF